jgi:ParB family chromosome partitioning protein
MSNVADRTTAGVAGARKPSKPPNVYAGLGDVLAGGFDHLLISRDHMTLVALADIEIERQIREEMEDEEQTLADLGRELRKRQAQNIVVRPSPTGHAKPYRLVAGERRVRAALVEDLTHLWALVADLTDDEARDLQAAENIHRKNLTLREQSRAVQADLDRLGQVELVLEKYGKSRAWLSKITGLLRLPAQAGRLVTENISADVEVIHGVKAVEEVDPERAKQLVEELKRSRGDASARRKVAEVKKEVKPRSGTARTQTGKHCHGMQAALPSPPAARKTATTSDERQLLSDAYVAIFERGINPRNVLAALDAGAQQAIRKFLSAFHVAGVQATDAPRKVLEGLRSGRFSSDGVDAFALLAYLDGVTGQQELELEHIFDLVKP